MRLASDSLTSTDEDKSAEYAMMVKVMFCGKFE